MNIVDRYISSHNVMTMLTSLNFFKAHTFQSTIFNLSQFVEYKRGHWNTQEVFHKKKMR